MDHEEKFRQQERRTGNPKRVVHVLLLFGYVSLLASILISQERSCVGFLLAKL